MKKSFFFLLTVALAALLSFSACTDDKDDGDGDKNSSSSSGDGTSSSSDGTPSGDLTAACRMEMEYDIAGLSLTIDLCGEVSGLSSSDVIESDAECIEEGGIPSTQCPSTELVCPAIDEDGIEYMVYYYEPGATAIKMAFNGGCPPPDIGL
jgi:hypothetical protein